jgi:serine/threonine-protein kinase
MTPETFGEHLLVKRLPGRTMSEVFLGVRLGDRTGRLLVVKRPALGERPSGAVAEAIRREAEVLGARRWPGTAALESTGTHGGLPWVAVEHVRGVPLDQLLAGRRLSEAAALQLGKDLARTLAELHAAGWVHGDVAPSNVVVDDAGEIVLVDFGLARRAGDSREGPSGKPGYAARDAALGRPAQPADDVYAWGAVVAECLLGRRLFDEQELAQASSRGPQLPAAVAAVAPVAAALSLDPSGRPTAAELAELPAKPGGRSELAERALGTASGPPTEQGVGAPAPAPVERLTQPISAVQAVAVPVVGPAVGLAAPARSNKALRGALVAGLVGVALLSFFAGRRTVKSQVERRDAKITIPSLPARTEIQIDGRTVIVPEAGRPLRIEPGRHTITVSLPRDEREYDVFVEPGDNVVLVPVTRLKKDKN